jgi:hypothetical protein
MFPNVGLLDINGCVDADDDAATPPDGAPTPAPDVVAASEDALWERMVKFDKKFNPKDGLLVGCWCCDRAGGSSGEDGRLEPGEFKGGVEVVDFVLAGGSTESLGIAFEEPSGMV